MNEIPSRQTSALNRRAIISASLLVLLVLKLLWGYWERGLTFGDTSSYFIHAVQWHYDNQVNIVWSPLYTAYYGSWLSVSDNAVLVTWLHRAGLILLSTALIAWLAVLTLPRLLALVLVVWWIGLPIHYDTLYTVHLFGAIPIFLMAIVSILMGERWRNATLIGIAVLTTVLIRNEYTLAVVVIWAMAALRLFFSEADGKLATIRSAALPYLTISILISLVFGLFYSASNVKREDMSSVSTPKHTLNMCQVYAFGYQQRHEDWEGSPWTECAKLMETEFGTSYPSLREMAMSNPKAVAEHMLWNASLTPAGMEVLLFNATSFERNPDYAPVKHLPILPTALFALTLLIITLGAVRVYRKNLMQYAHVRNYLYRMSPLLLSLVAMAIAVILTQRPRPSYLLGFGVLYIWVALLFLSTYLTRFKWLNGFWLTSAVIAASIAFMPSYRSLNLPSQNDMLSQLYTQLKPNAANLCRSTGGIAIGDYYSELNNYLCAPYSGIPKSARSDLLSLAGLPEHALSSPMAFVHELEGRNVDRVIIDPYLILKNPGLLSCSALLNAFQEKGWQQLTYSSYGGPNCIAALAK